MALHQNSNENNKHTPKGFTSAPNMGKILRDENGLSTYVPETTLPASLNFVNGAVAPPTEVLNQVYVIVDTGGGTIHPNWDGLVYNNWCRFDGVSWIGYTPVNGDICYDSTALKYKIFQTTAWIDFGVSGGGGGGDTNISTTDLTFAANRYVDLSSFSWTLGGTAPIGSEKISFQKNTLIKGSDTSASTSGFKVLNADDDVLLDSRNNGQTGINGSYDGSNALMVRNPNNEPFILELENFAGTPAFQVTDSGQLLTKQSNAIVFYTYRQGGQSRIQLYDGAVKSFEFNKVLSFTTGQLVIDGSTGKTKSILTLNQASASVNAQNFFANITTTTAGRVASSSSFGTTEKGFECFDTDLDKKCVWNGSAWEKITSVII